VALFWGGQKTRFFVIFFDFFDKKTIIFDFLSKMKNFYLKKDKKNKNLHKLKLFRARKIYNQKKFNIFLKILPEQILFLASHF